jgi:hypothetical protein
MMSNKMLAIVTELYDNGGWGTFEEIKSWLNYRDGRKLARRLQALKRRGLLSEGGDFREIDEHKMNDVEWYYYYRLIYKVYALTPEGFRLAEEVKNVDVAAGVFDSSGA